MMPSFGLRFCFPQERNNSPQEPWNRAPNIEGIEEQGVIGHTFRQGLGPGLFPGLLLIGRKEPLKLL
jgi:hypothetical protein